MEHKQELNYIEDLMRRMNTREEGDVFSPSSETVSFRAYRETEKLTDLSILQQIIKIVTSSKKLDSATSKNLAKILSELIRNTHDSSAINMYLELIDRSPISWDTTMYLISGAQRAKIRECRDFVLGHLETKHDNVLSTLIEYFGELGDKNDISIIGDLLDADCNGITNPMYCAFALKKIGHKDALPYLERAVARHAKSRKREGIDTLSYSANAIETLSN